MGSLRRWTPAEHELLCNLYPHFPDAQVALALGRSIPSVWSRASQYRIHKSAEYLATHPTGRFVKGQKSWNKGKHCIAGGRSAETRFKMAVAPHNWQPIGTEVTCPDGYLKRKVSDLRAPARHDWKFVHVMVWEAANGPVPKGHAVVFRDGNKQHIDLGNLELISRAELGRRNIFHNRYPAEVKGVIHARARLTRMINKRSKNEEQAL